MLKVDPHPDYPPEEGRYLRGNDRSPAVVVVILNDPGDKGLQSDFHNGALLEVKRHLSCFSRKVSKPEMTTGRVCEHLSREDFQMRQQPPFGKIFGKAKRAVDISR